MLDIYVISDDYIDFLRNTKGLNKVYDHEKLTRVHERKYIGVVLEINDYRYFAPFSSPKPSDFNEDGIIRNSTVSILRMTKNDARGVVLLGTITLNNMIPVPDAECFKYDLESEPDVNYKNLVTDEIRWVQKHDTEIIEKCRNLYYLKINEETRRTERNGKTLDATINFKEAEVAYNEWKTLKR